MSGLHPTVEHFLRASAAGFPDPPRTLADRRAALRRRSDGLFAAYTEPCTAPVTVEEIAVPGPAGPLRARVYRPVDRGDAAPLAPHLVLHGGGWWLGTIDEDIVDHTCRWRAHDAGVAVVALEYRLAPEHPFPAALEDAWAALLWLDGHAVALGFDATRLTVGGASAGANLAAALCLLTARRGGPRIAFAALEVPAVDLSRWGHDTGATSQGDESAIDGTDMAAAIGHYLTSPATQSLDPLASPLLADDLHLMPTTQIVTAEHDPLRAEAIEMVAALRTAGVAVLHVDIEGAVHGAPYLTGVWPQARRWRRTVDHALHEACNAVTPRDAIDVA